MDGIKKLVVLVSAVFLIPILSVVGKSIYDSITENYTFTNTVGNLTLWPWLVPYARSMWWILPIGAVVFIILWLMKRYEPPPTTFPTYKLPKQPKIPIKGKNPPPPIFLGK